MSVPIFVALDVDGPEAALALVEQTQPAGITHYKVGLSLFYQAGLPLVQQLQARGLNVFVDLKLHDIPNTVARTVRVLVRGGVRFLNVHCLGGLAMMQAAAEAAKDEAERCGLPQPTVLGVTILTSHSPESLKAELSIDRPLEQQVLHLAQLAKQAGLQGVVCSPWEAGAIAEACGEAFLRVTPGIRLPENEVGDQSRIATPAKAVELGATHLVVGRPIYGAANPGLASGQILQACQEA